MLIFIVADAYSIAFCFSAGLVINFCIHGAFRIVWRRRRPSSVRKLKHLNCQLSLTRFHRAYIKAEYPYHTHHQHHTEKIPEIKIIKVPVVKEIKIPHPYKVHYKVRVPYIVKQEIHTVPIHTHPVHTSEHVHHHSTSHPGSHSGFGDSSSGYGGSSSDFGGSSFGAGGSSFGSNANYGSGSSFGSGGSGFIPIGNHGFSSSHGASSNVAPMFISHTPVAMTSHSMFSDQSVPRLMQVVSPKIVHQQSSQQNQFASAPKSIQQSVPQQNQIPNDSKFVEPTVTKNLFQSSNPLYITGLNTMIQASAGGFKTHEAGTSGGYEVREATNENGPAMFKPSTGGNSQESAGSDKSSVAYPYPLQSQHEKNPFEYSFGFKPSDPLYGF